MEEICLNALKILSQNREVIIIAALAVLLFGSKKIPELSKSIVEAIKHMRGAFKDVEAPQASSTDIKKK